LAKTLFIDLDEVNQNWENLDIKCSYPYHFNNNGILSLREWLAFQIICRKCEGNPCIEACRYEALEKIEDTGIITRNNCLGRRRTSLCKDGQRGYKIWRVQREQRREHLPGRRNTGKVYTVERGTNYRTR